MRRIVALAALGAVLLTGCGQGGTPDICTEALDAYEQAMGTMEEAGQLSSEAALDLINSALAGGDLDSGKVDQAQARITDARDQWEEAKALGERCRG